MREFLILKLQGPMQAWGEHTFEGLRPSGNFPTRSGILGLLGACLGLRRNEHKKLQALADSVGMAVRVDERSLSGNRKQPLKIVKMADYHTVQNARVDYLGLKSHETIQTWREYLFDAEFTVALWTQESAAVSLDEMEKAIRQPVFTPYLGRRSCPLARPLFEARLCAESTIDVMVKISPAAGTIYSEEGQGERLIRIRDVPLTHQPRQFASRILSVIGGTSHVPE